MRILLLFAFFLTSLFAKEYYAKVEPIDIFTIASNVQGEVLQAEENMLGKKLTRNPYIVIDAKLDKLDLIATNEKIAVIQELIEADLRIMENLRDSLKRKEENYDKIKDLLVKSKTQKDAIYFDVIATKNQLLNTQKEINNYKSQLADLRYKKERLQKSIADKVVANPGMVLYELLVKKAQVVNPATPLAKVADISKALLTIYVDANELEGVEKKSVYLDGKKTDYKVSRVSYITDSANISKYKVQIVIDPVKIFSKLVKVELK